MIARDFIEPSVTIDGKETVGYAINFMSSNYLRELMVKSQNEILIITAHWLLERGVRDEMPVSSMAFALPLIEPGNNAMTVILKMVSSGVETLPIIEKNRLVGAITSYGILKKLKIPGKVKEAMIRVPVYVKLSDTIKKAKLLMSINGVNRLPVVEDEVNSKVVGVISSSDIISKVYGSKSKFLSQPTLSEERIRILSRHVDEIMSTPAIFTQPDEDLDAAVRKLLKNEKRMLPVISEGKLIGVLCIKDILRYLVRRYY